jgi:Flp pilus assembly protein TadG
LRRAPASRSASRAPRGGLAGDVRGAAGLEFALVVGALIVLVLGTLEVGRALMARNEVNHAIGRAARSVHIQPSTTSEAVAGQLKALLADHGRTDLDVSVTEVAGTRYMRISVRFPYELQVPLLPAATLDMDVETLAPMVGPMQ